MPEIQSDSYKDAQLATRLQLSALKRGNVVWDSGNGPAYLGIREFKRRNPGNHVMINTYKQNFWASIKEHNTDKEEQHVETAENTA